MTKHKHLRVVIEDIRSNNNELTPELNSRLINEIRYSNLHIPAKKDENGLNFIIIEDNALKLTPLFTDTDEFNKFFKDTENITLLENSFELYRNVVRKGDIEGYILNPASEGYVLSKEFISDIAPPKTNFYSTDTYLPEELKKLKNTPNESLEKFIKNPGNALNYEGLFEELSKSNLLALMISDRDLSSKAVNGVISLKDSGPVARMYTDNVGGVYGAIFSGEDKIDAVESDCFKYSQVVNLAMFVNFVLSEDMEGIVLNPGSDDVLIPRVALLRYSLGFEKFACDEKLSESIFYMFLRD